MINQPYHNLSKTMFVKGLCFQTCTYSTIICVPDCSIINHILLTVEESQVNAVAVDHLVPNRSPMVPTTFMLRPPKCMAIRCQPKHHPGKFDMLSLTLIMGNKSMTFYLFMYWQRNCYAIGVYLIVYINQWQPKFYLYANIKYIPYNICSWFCLC